jgi:hypothetical protein
MAQPTTNIVINFLLNMFRFFNTGRISCALFENKRVAQAQIYRFNFRTITYLKEGMRLTAERPCPSGKTHYHAEEVETINKHKELLF